MVLFLASSEARSSSVVLESSRRISRVIRLGPQVNADVLLKKFNIGIKKTQKDALEKLRRERGWGDGYVRSFAPVLKDFKLPNGTDFNIHVLTEIKKSSRVGYYTSQTTGISISSNTDNATFLKILETMGAEKRTIHSVTRDGVTTRTVNIPVRNDYDLTITRIRLIDLVKKLNNSEIGVDLGDAATRTRVPNRTSARR